MWDIINHNRTLFTTLSAPTPTQHLAEMWRYCYACNGTYLYGLVTCTVCSKYITLLWFFSSETIILSNCVSRPRNSEWQMQYNNTLWNHASHMITHCLYGQFIQTWQNGQNLWENSVYRNDDYTFHWILPWRFASLFTNPIAVSCSNWARYLSSGGWLLAPLWADMLEICEIYHQREW